MNSEDKATYTLVVIAIVLVTVLYMFGKTQGNGAGGKLDMEFCGTSTFGECSSDADCTTSGCSSQICQSTSEEEKASTCEWKECYDSEKYGLGCKCVEGQCQWT